MEGIGKITAITALAYWLTACSEPQSHLSSKPSRPVQPLEEGYGVSFKQVQEVKSGYNAQGQPTVAIVLGANSRNSFEVILLRSNIKAGYAVQSRSVDHPEIMLSAEWDGDRYIQSAEHATSANLKIRSLTPEKAVIYVSGTLVNPSTSGLLTLSSSMVWVQGEFLEELLAEQ